MQLTHFVNELCNVKVKAAAAVGSLRTSASKLVQFDFKAEAPELSKKERMEQALLRLSKKEKDLAQQYFNMIDENKDGVLTKLELQVMLLPHLCHSNSSLKSLRMTFLSLLFRTSSSTNSALRMKRSTSKRAFRTLTWTGVLFIACEMCQRNLIFAPQPEWFGCDTKTYRLARVYVWLSIPFQVPRSSFS
jgi:hypothetical protein